MREHRHEEVVVALCIRQEVKVGVEAAHPTTSTLSDSYFNTERFRRHLRGMVRRPPSKEAEFQVANFSGKRACGRASDKICPPHAAGPPPLCAPLPTHLAPNRLHMLSLAPLTTDPSGHGLLRLSNVVLLEIGPEAFEREVEAAQLRRSSAFLRQPENVAPLAVRFDVPLNHHLARVPVLDQDAIVGAEGLLQQLIAVGCGWRRC